VSEEGMSPGLGEVEVLIEREIDQEGVYVIVGEDHTLGNLLEKVLLGMDGVTFASYETPHPLEHRIILKISTDGSLSPRKALKTALRRILDLIQEFREDYTSALGLVEGKGEE